MSEQTGGESDEHGALLDSMNLHWFGPSWHHDPNTSGVARQRVDPPVGEPCAYCLTPIRPGQRGMTIPKLTSDGVSRAAYHVLCFLLMILGPDHVAQMLEENAELATEFRPW